MPAAPSEQEAQLWEWIIHPRGPMSRSTARRILELELAAEDHARIHSLDERNQRDALSDDEQMEFDEFCLFEIMLSILKVRARRVLNSRQPI